MPSDGTPKRPNGKHLRSKPLRQGPSDDLLRLRRGELTANEYLQSRVEQATGHLRGRVSSRRLERIRRLVVEACSNDPVLLAMKSRLVRLRR